MNDTLFQTIQAEDDESATLAFCTQDPYCQADVDQHLNGCPIEDKLKDEFGF